MNAISQKAKEIFVSLVDGIPESEREKRADEACQGDVELRRRVHALFLAHAQPDSRLEHAALDFPLTVDRSIETTEKLGALIGPYKLLEQIGEGGMGLVYMAEQQQPVRRLVALKLVKPGMDSKQVIARFEAERQALAMMDHPNIAKVHDAGTTETGRPYFVMELVRGIPLNEFCDQKRLAVRDRLQLFVQVCQAVQHAHQKGIIHRDLKPTNVLVAMADTVAFPKLLDFGIAKALGQSLTDSTLHTGYSQLVGTPLYMSPEQAEMNVFGVDTRSDVYSLGVLLYELLTGTTPFDKERLTKASFDEMRRMIREDEPPRPSARMSTLKAQALSTISQQRNIEPRRISATLRGELDWIVMKALDKDRSRRYESASSLAADIQRYLSDEPVLACPPTTMYRFQKFARKHKPALATAAAIAACLILGTTVSAWQAARATTAEAQANANANQAQISSQEAKAKAQEASAQRNEAQQQRDEAQRQRDEVKNLNDTLQRTLYAAHLNLARHAWEEAAVPRMQQLLAEQRPKPGQPDLRGFEWDYLNRLCHSELLTLKGHTGEVTSVAYSPDGKRLASASADKTVKVWDAQTGQELLTFKGHTGEVNSIAFSPDGKRLASCTGSSQTPGNNAPGGLGLKVWDAQTGQELLTIESGYNCVAFSPDGKRLASRGKVFDAQTGQELASFKGDGDSVAFSPDGRRLASGGKVFDASSGEELLTLQGHPGIQAFSPGGKILASISTDYNTVKVSDAQTGQELLTLKHSRVVSAAFSPNGSLLASGSWLGTVRIWDSKTGQEIRTLKGSGSSVKFSPDGQRLASIANNTVKILDPHKDAESVTLEGEYGGSFVFSPDWRRFASAISTDNTVKVRDSQTGQLIHTLKGHTVPLQSLAFSPDGKRLASGGGGRRSPDGGPASTSRDPSEVKVWDALSGQELLTVKGVTGGFVNSVAFSPDGKRLASHAGGGETKVWDAQTGQELLSLKNGGGMRVAYSPDGKFLATAGRLGVKIWNAETGQQLLTLLHDWGTNIAFSPDGKHIATVARDNTMKVWNAQTGHELFSLTGHTGRVFSVIFSPDGKRLASASNDYTVKVWDSQNGQELLTLHGGGYGVAFSPDGYRLASPADKGLTIWDATPLPEKP